MTEIKSWAIILCVSLLISSVILFIAPDGSMKKYLSYIISVFILTVVLLPLSKMDFSHITDFSAEDMIVPDEEYSAMLNEYIYDGTEQVVKNNIKHELDKICTDNYSVEVTFKSSRYQIKAEKIIIFINETDIKNIALIRKKTGELTGIIPEVKIYELQSNN